MALSIEIGLSPVAGTSLDTSPGGPAAALLIEAVGGGVLIEGAGGYLLL